MRNAIREFWIAQYRSSGMVPPFVCKDGFNMSIQANEYAYCLPVGNLPRGDYTHWEVAFPSQEEPSLLPYKMGQDAPCNSVYQNVPTDVINVIIGEHGGIIGALSVVEPSFEVIAIGPFLIVIPR